ncbi:protein-L-isoaspartate(D-aspartate) O-methyltransferase [Candidatus Woesearchaeota archaeon]|nr:protein-L-isoaspartate(D-aspartate) O-methyltransferase [Candidatus Woesearchaeota archaeon]
MNFEKERKEMVENQIRKRGIRDKNVLKAMLKVKRHEFVPEDNHDEAYSDWPLAIGHGQTISQPYIVALMTELLELKGNEKVLEIGTGSGYQAAVLAEIAAKVVSMERVGELSQTARKRLAKYDNIELVTGNGAKGYAEEAPYDAIIATAAAAEIPRALVEQLCEGGILVIPVGDFLYQNLVKIKKTKKKIIERKVLGVRFVPLISE